jgi:hypothetical protein
MQFAESEWTRTDILKTNLHDEGLMWSRCSLCSTGVFLFFDALSITLYKSVFDDGD